MSSELSILALYGLLTVVVMLIHILLATGQVGMPYLASPRDEKRDLTGVTGRAERCLNNSIVAMALFAPPILILGLLDAYSGATLLAAQVFLIARLIYAPLYWVGVPYLRTGAWVVGFLATAYLFWAALGATP